MKEFVGFTRGVNLGGWLSQCDYSDERLHHFIEEQDFARIASWGLDHVRLPFDFNIIDAPQGFNENGFAHLERAVGWAKKYSLNIVLDLHKTAGYSFDAGENESGFFDSEALQDKFYALWIEVARRFGKETHVAFELLNEVTEKEFSEKWNEIAETCIKKIRVFAPTTPILVGSYYNNHVSAVKDLRKPYDEYVVYNFHCYDPLLFTHQFAPWVTTVDVNHRLSFADCDAGKTENYFENLFAEAIDYAKQQDTVLYCGEYGVIENVDAENLLAWYKAINTVFRKHGIGRAAWSYKKMDFDLGGERLDVVRDELNQYL